jgi:hypothetical protein
MTFEFNFYNANTLLMLPKSIIIVIYIKIIILSHYTAVAFFHIFIVNIYNAYQTLSTLALAACQDKEIY